MQIGASSMSGYSGLLLSLMSTFAFNRTSKLLEKSRLTQPIATKNNPYLSWKWRNYLISFVHSFVTGVGSILCFYEEPQLIKEIVYTESQAAYLLVCFSQGYFIYDLIEMALITDHKGSRELIVHHILILSCFFISVWQHKYLGYCCLALLVELNNVFLHVRQLLNISQVSRRSLIYRINSYINLVSFVVFRFMTMTWLASCLIAHRNQVPKRPHFVATLTLIIIFAMTCVLFYRLIDSDFIRPPPEQSTHQLEHETGHDPTTNGLLHSNGSSLSSETDFNDVSQGEKQE